MASALTDVLRVVRENPRIMRRVGERMFTPY